MQKRLIIDNYTSFEEVMGWINSVDNTSERAARARHVIDKIPQLHTAMQIYFGDKKYSLSRLGRLSADLTVRENGIKDKQNFHIFFKDIELLSDESPLDEHKLISKFLSILDYTNVDDIGFIKQVIYLEQIEAFDEFGIDTYYILNGK